MLVKEQEVLEILPSPVVVRQHLSTEVPGSIPGGGSVTDTIFACARSVQCLVIPSDEENLTTNLTFFVFGLHS